MTNAEAAVVIVIAIVNGLVAYEVIRCRRRG